MKAKTADMIIDGLGRLELRTIRDLLYKEVPADKAFEVEDAMIKATAQFSDKEVIAGAVMVILTGFALNGKEWVRKWLEEKSR